MSRAFTLCTCAASVSSNVCFAAQNSPVNAPKRSAWMAADLGMRSWTDATGMPCWRASASTRSPPAAVPASAARVVTRKQFIDAGAPVPDDGCAKLMQVCEVKSALLHSALALSQKNTAATPPPAGPGGGFFRLPMRLPHPAGLLLQLAEALPLLGQPPLLGAPLGLSALDSSSEGGRRGSRGQHMRQLHHTGRFTHLASLLGELSLQLSHCPLSPRLVLPHLALVSGSRRLEPAVALDCFCFRSLDWRARG